MTDSPRSIGIDAKVAGVPEFLVNMGQLQAALDKATQALTKNTEALNKATDKVSNNVKKATTNTKDLGNSFQEVSNKVVSLISSLTGLSTTSVKAGLAIGGLGIALDRMLEAGIQGAKVSAVERGFERIVVAAQGSASKLLAEMRTATAGMISDFELMQRTNIMLTGLYEETGKSFVDHMGELLAIARAQAKLTGQDFNTVYTGMMDGLKRNEFHMLANIGISIRAEEVYARYAKTVGKTASQLNAAERQQAALNEVLSMGISLTKVAGSIQEDAADKYAQMLATLSNMTNKMGQVFEPLIRGVYDFVNSILGPLKGALDSIAPLLAAAFQGIGVFLTNVGKIVGEILKFLNIGGWIGAFIKAGAVLIGALATGIIWALNNILLPAVEAVADVIASFLIGESPPPKGPLHFIDVGGQKVLEAWLTGFMGVDLEPVNEVAAYVQETMGDIAYFSREQVAAELKALDEALNPYVDKLNILKAQFDALKPSTDAAFSAIDRQLAISVKALIKGDEQAAATTRYLDAQKSALQDYLDQQQQLIDQQTLQVALVQAQQAEERVLLAIRERQLGPEEKVTEEKDKQAKKDKEAGGGVPEASPSFTGFGEGQPGATDWDTKLAGAGKELEYLFGATGLQGQLDQAGTTMDRIKQKMAGTWGKGNTFGGQKLTIWSMMGYDSEEAWLTSLGDAGTKTGDAFSKAFDTFIGTRRGKADTQAFIAKVAGYSSWTEYYGSLTTTGKASADKVVEGMVTGFNAGGTAEGRQASIKATWDLLFGPQANAADVASKFQTNLLENLTKPAMTEKGNFDKATVLLASAFGYSSVEGFWDSIKGTGDLTLFTLLDRMNKDIPGFFANTLDKEALKVALTTFLGGTPAAALSAASIVDQLATGISTAAVDTKYQTKVSTAIRTLFSSVDLTTRGAEIGLGLKNGIMGSLGSLGTIGELQPPNTTGSGAIGSMGAGSLPRIVETKSGGGGSMFSGISTAIQSAIEGSLSKDFKDRFAHMIYTFVVIDMQGGFTKGLDQIFAVSGKDNVFSRLLDFKDNTNILVLNAMLTNIDIFIASVDTSLSQLPVILVGSALNPMLVYFNEFKNNFVKGINELITSLNALFDSMNTAFGSYGMGKLGAIAAISVPDFPLIGAAQGGIFKMLQVGERGPELMGPAQQIGVLPTALMTDIKAILSSVSSVAAMPTFAGGHSSSYNSVTNYSNNSNMTNNFNGSSNPNNIAARLHYMKALGLV